MTTGDKIAALRRQNHLTQEQLAQLLGVSRQSISKYESDLAYPETEKLIRLSDLFGCTVDELLRDRPPGEGGGSGREGCSAAGAAGANEAAAGVGRTFAPGCAAADEAAGAAQPIPIPGIRIGNWIPTEKKSEKTLWGLPLWHIGKNAKGIIAVGWRATGVLSVGFLATGIVSFGFLSLGVIALGLLALGLLAAGTFALGAVAAGAVAVGLIAFGAVAVGHIAIGAAAYGKYYACGDYAQAMFAYAKTTANGSVMGWLWGQTDVPPHSLAMEMWFPKAYHWLIPLLTGGR